MKAQILAAALLLGTSTFALAADSGLPMDQPPVGFNWTGGYIGGQVGYQWSTDDVVDPVGGAAGSFDVEGALAGVHAGYEAA